MQHTLQFLDKQEMKSGNSKSAVLQKIAHCVKKLLISSVFAVTVTKLPLYDADDEGYVCTDASGNVHC